jgi:hypothetical protein
MRSGAGSARKIGPEPIAPLWLYANDELIYEVEHLCAGEAFVRDLRQNAGNGVVDVARQPVGNGNLVAVSDLVVRDGATANAWNRS